jgi:hypothetical protein
MASDDKHRLAAGGALPILQLPDAMMRRKVA